MVYSQNFWEKEGESVMKYVSKKNYIHVESLQPKINLDSINFNTMDGFPGMLRTASDWL